MNSQQLETQIFDESRLAHKYNILELESKDQLAQDWFVSLVFHEVAKRKTAWEHFEFTPQLLDPTEERMIWKQNLWNIFGEFRDDKTRRFNLMLNFKPEVEREWIYALSKFMLKQPESPLRLLTTLPSSRKQPVPSDDFMGEDGVEVDIPFRMPPRTQRTVRVRIKRTAKKEPSKANLDLYEQ